MGVHDVKVAGENTWHASEAVGHAMGASDTRLCPFCAESIRVEAIKCRHCGEALDSTALSQMRADTPILVVEQAREFIVQLEETAYPRITPIDISADAPFSNAYLRGLGMKLVRDIDCWRRMGLTHVWVWAMPYFLARLEELRHQGWELAEDLRQCVDADGWLQNPFDRLHVISVQVPSFFGPRTLQVIAGGKFRMRRIRGFATGDSPRKHIDYSPGRLGERGSG